MECGILETMKIRCWIAPRDIIPGTDWSESILTAIQTSVVLVLVFLARANASAHVKREIERTIHNGIAVLPFRIEAVSPSASLEFFISTSHWLDAMTPPLERHVERLAAAIRELIGNQTGGERAVGAGPLPSPHFSSSMSQSNRAEMIQKQLSEFFRPIHTRLKHNNISWERILDLKNAERSTKRHCREHRAGLHPSQS